MGHADDEYIDGLCNQIDKLTAELTALRNRYSTECPDCCGVGYEKIFVGHKQIPCEKCHGTGRVMMLDAEDIRHEFEKGIYSDSNLDAALLLALKMVLEGKR